MSPPQSDNPFAGSEVAKLLDLLNASEQQRDLADVAREVLGQVPPEAPEGGVIETPKSPRLAQDAARPFVDICFWCVRED